MPLWDYAVEGEGETALLGLSEFLRGVCTIETIPNLIYCDPAGARRSAAGRHEENIHTLNTPDFRGLRLNKYFTPAPVFLLPVARGCYMRCTFCAISYATSGYRCRTGEEIVRDVRTVQEHFGADAARSFNFSIDVMAPKHLDQMATAFLEANLNIIWDAEIRLDRTLSKEIIQKMRRAGCCHLRFGLESAVDRVRTLMDKRIQIDRVREILQDCRAEDIKVSTMIIIGFPGETEPEARRTFEFLWDNNDKIRFFALNVYTVSRGSIIAAKPEEFAVDLRMRSDRLVQPSWDFDVRQGITTRQARRLVGEFRSRLLERYPLAEEGFSVGIGGTFTFMVTARWSWRQLLEFDHASNSLDDRKQPRSSDVPRLMPWIEIFRSPYQYDEESAQTRGGAVTYLSIRRDRLLRLEEDAARAVLKIDGKRKISDIALEIEMDPDSDSNALASLCALFSSLRSKGVVALDSRQTARGSAG